MEPGSRGVRFITLGFFLFEPSFPSGRLGVGMPGWLRGGSGGQAEGIHHLHHPLTNSGFLWFRVWGDLSESPRTWANGRGLGFDGFRANSPTPE